jgi:hypothetical protein
MSIPKDYRVARKRFRWIWIHPTWGKKRAPSTKIIPKSQKRIQEFVNWIPKKQEHYIYRFPRVKIPRYEDYGIYSISKMEWDMHRCLKGFDGFFENLFEFNDFDYFQDLQGILEDQGVSFKNMFLEDVIAYELLPINLGFKNYKGIEKLSKLMMEPPLVYITHDHEFFPDAADLSYVLTKIPADALFEFFQLLVKE